ncbi:MAG TPA: Asp23/Gls24 family envelope stress response protein [Bacillales bacterium]|nr:Asp23/Gls24 family envelope stress response protein [Bacillales bacterium]
MLVKPLPKGSLHITDEVMALIAEAAINETEGVAGTISGIRDEVARVINKNPARGITVQTGEEETVIDVKVALLFGVKVRDICHQLQEKIKQEVEMMTGVAVASVNIFVEQITFPEE